MLRLITPDKVSCSDGNCKPKAKVKPLKYIIMDSLVVAGIVFCSAPAWEIATMLTTAKASGLAFFIQFAYDRGLKTTRER